MKITAAAATLPALLCCACAIVPKTEDFSKYDIYDIVQTIQCETQLSLQHVARHQIAIDDPDLAEQLKNNPEMFETLPYDKLSPRIRDVLDKYDQSFIVFDWNFDITQNNSAGASIDLTRLYTRGALKTGASIEGGQERRSRYKFRTGNSFGDFAGMPKSYCKTANRHRNQAYPIAGTVGMLKILQSFISLNRSGFLIGAEDVQGIPQQTVTLDFTTSIAGSINPVLQLAAVGTTSVTGASLQGASSRKDLHTVVITMTLPPDKKPAAKREGLRKAGEINSATKYEQREDEKARVLDALGL